MPPFEEYVKEIESIWTTRWLTNSGEKHRALEDALCSFLDVKNISLFTNGHLALETALNALSLKGEVITTPFTFASTTQAIVRTGLTPVFCDINPFDYTIDVNQIESLITEKTSAILAVHVYGSICDVEAINAIAEKHHLKVIYDAAHAFGESYKGKSVATFGDYSMFSFHATKVFHSIEGGCLTYNSEPFRAKIEAMKNFGQYSPENVGEVGFNAKMNEFQAAMGLCNLRHVREEISKREKASLLYRKLLPSVEGISLMREDPNTVYNYAYFPILVDPAVYGHNRNWLFDKLKENGVLSRKYFYPLTSAFSCYDGLFPIQQTPVATRIADQVLALPMYAGLAEEDVESICRLIATH